jgi:hypothetical protein
MTKRMLLAGLLSLSAVPALASDVSPFYKGPYAVMHTNETRTEAAKKPEGTNEGKVANGSESASSAACKCQRPSS